MKQLTVFAFIFMFSLSAVTAQELCKVKLKSIDSTYSGDCVDGLAEGKGKSVGVDEYQGEFKKGLPEGEGMYTWKDGHYYVGHFKKGLLEGEGKMYYESKTGADSIISGFWKKDKYYGQYKDKYLIISRSSHLAKVDVQLISPDKNNINVEVHQLNMGIAYVADISVVNGSLYSKRTQNLSNRSITYLQDVTFPFRAIFTLTSGDIVEIQFNEKGSYVVTLNIE